MNRPIEPGRVDQLAHGCFKAALKQYAHPNVRFACAILDKEFAQCFEQHVGPGTPAQDFFTRFLDAIAERFR